MEKIQEKPCTSLVFWLYPRWWAVLACVPTFFPCNDYKWHCKIYYLTTLPQNMLGACGLVKPCDFKLENAAR